MTAASILPSLSPSPESPKIDFHPSFSQSPHSNRGLSAMLSRTQECLDDDDAMQCNAIRSDLRCCCEFALLLRTHSPDPDAAYCTCPLADPELSKSSTRTLGGSAAAHKARQGIRLAAPDSEVGACGNPPTPAARLRGFAAAPKSFPTRDSPAI